MLYILLGLIIGAIIGALSQLSIPHEYTHISAVTLLGMLDTIFGAVRAHYTENDYNLVVLSTGFLFNALLAILITLIGQVLGLDLYLAATIVFTFRIFQNVGAARRAILDHWIQDHERHVQAKKARLENEL